MNTALEIKALSQESLIDRFGGFVRNVVRRMRTSLSSRVEYDDLQSYGMLGLLEAQLRFDPEGSTSFETFAYYRIRGAVLDGCRKEGWLSRDRNKLARRMRSIDALMEDVSSERESTGPAKSLEDAVNVVTEIVGVAATVILMHDSNWEEYLGSEEATQHTHIEERQSQVLLKTAMKTLTEEERDIVIRFDFNNEKMDEIASAYGMSKAWVSRIRTRALQRLRAFIEHRE